MTHSIKWLVEQRQKAYQSDDEVKWRSLRNSVRQEIRLAKQKFYSEAVQQLKQNDPRKWHSQIQKLCHLKPKRTMVPGAKEDPRATSEVINRHFANTRVHVHVSVTNFLH
jgi:hypothetical protein